MSPHHELPEEAHGKDEETVPFFPDHLVKEGAVLAFVVGLIVFLATMFPMPVGEPADPIKTPPGIKPEWYFLPVYQLLKYVPRTIGVVFNFVLFPVIFMIFPFFYKPIARYKYGRLILHTVGGLGMLLAVFLAMLAYLGFE